MTPLKLSTTKSEHKSEQVVETLAQAIVRKDYQEGVFLPSEGELCRQYGVSRSVIRDTIRRIAAAGLVETRHGIGTYINPSSEWNLFDPLLLAAFIDSGNLPAISQELVELRTMVEIESARLAAQRITPRTRQLLHEWLEQMEIGIDDIETFVRADVAFHNLIIASTENRFLIQITKYLTGLSIESRRITSEIGGSAGRREAQQWHCAIYEALCQQNPAAASDAMRQHMEQLREIMTRALRTLAPPGD